MAKQSSLFIFGFCSSLLVFVFTISFLCWYLPRRNFKRVLRGKAFAIVTPIKSENSDVYILKITQNIPTDE